MAGSGSSEIVHSTAAQYAPWILLLPMLAFPIILYLGKALNGNKMWKDTLKEGGLIALGFMGASLVLSLWLVIDFIGAYGGTEMLSDWTWFTSSMWMDGDNAVSTVSFGFGIHIDHITVMLLFIASFLCLLINTFAIGYMNTDPINDNRNHRFYAEFVLFCSGMLGMVLADSFLWLFIFWELMGLCSYLLIGFYYERPSAAYAAKKAFLTTRVGDVFLMVGLAILWDLFGSLDYAVVFDSHNIEAVANNSAGTLAWALGLMFIGAVGKSAQFPLHVWLPDAMEGPTPVSALIHAATMVNAGLYLVARMFPFFGHEAMQGELADLAFIIAAIGGTTAVMAAAIAFVQHDLKKVLAYSTMSQLAYIFTGLGAALYLANTLDWHKYLADGTTNPDYYVNHGIVIVAFGAALFHLFNHAMAKGMLFMASGAVIHEVHHAHHHLHHHDDDHGHGDPEELVMLAKYLNDNDLTVYEFFKSIDLDGSGDIDMFEFQKALTASQIANLPPWEMTALVKAVDLNGDGRLNLPELDLALGRIISDLDHGHHDEFDAQSMENMGGLASKMPITATAMLVGSLSIMGFPLIGGFWSKEGIIANTWRVALDDPRFFYPALCVLLGAGMTGFYMSRMWLKTFAGSPKGEVAAHVHPTNTWIKIPLFTLTFFSLGGVILASMGFTHWAPDIEYGLMSDHGGFIGGFLYEMEHVFANSKPFFFILTYIAIFIGAIVGPGIALSLYGGALDEGETVKPWFTPVLALNAAVKGRYHWDNSALAGSGFATALSNRLYFDHYYDMAMLKIVAAFSNKAAEADASVIDGTVKTIERTSQDISTKVRALTTGSARDYILMAAVGTLALVGLIWGVVA